MFREGGVIAMATKAKSLQDALEKGYLPKLCSTKERWHDRKCSEYCSVADNCPYGRLVKQKELAA